jgi:hypothetical protein
LTKDAACAKEREGNADNRSDGTLARLGRLLRDVLDDLHSARVEKVAQLLGDLVPGSCWIIPENYSDNREQNENQRRERKDGVVGKGRAQLRCFIL